MSNFSGYTVITSGPGRPSSNNPSSSLTSSLSNSTSPNNASRPPARTTSDPLPLQPGKGKGRNGKKQGKGGSHGMIVSGPPPTKGATTTHGMIVSGPPSTQGAMTMDVSMGGVLPVRSSSLQGEYYKQTQAANESSCEQEQTSLPPLDPPLTLASLVQPPRPSEPPPHSESPRPSKPLPPCKPTPVRPPCNP